MIETGRDGRRLKRAISFVVHQRGTTGRILIVRRPEDDEELPGVWGLPAGSLRAEEGWADAVRRAGREKLGVELEVGRLLREGAAERRAYTLYMRLFRARITQGEPTLPQSRPHGRCRPQKEPHRNPQSHLDPRPRADQGGTRYRDWRWATADALRPAADVGSLCSRLYLAARSSGPAP